MEKKAVSIYEMFEELEKRIATLEEELAKIKKEKTVYVKSGTTVGTMDLGQDQKDS